MNSCRDRKVKIEVVGLHKSYMLDGLLIEVLGDINIHACEEEFVSIIGPSGCGKSTLFNIICGLQAPDSGNIYLNGTEISGKTGMVGYMLQKDLLLPWRKVIDNVILGLELSMNDRKKNIETARELLTTFGLEGFENAYPASLSGGMRQRAALLRTYLLGREVMLLDEPFGALDAITRSELQDWLLKVWDRFKKTILFVTHDVEEAAYLSDRIYIMTARPGKIKEETKVNMPRPRNRDITDKIEFKNLVGKLLKLLEY
ncbi:MAG: ABC transporter ATP-binding protein [Actinobacteria bacterium]|nr:ABC transporter ATP-binding protein [Actinomycetota bacterium]